MSGALSIDWAPFFPWALLGIFALAALATLALALWRRARGLWWRALALTALLLALANPTLIREERNPLKDIALVVIDESPSQRIAPRETQTLEAAQHVIEAIERLRGTEVRVLRAGGGAGSAEEDGTRLFTALRQGLSRVPRQRVAGVIMISDGQVHDLPESLEALGLNAPLHLLLTGGADEADRRLIITQAPSFGIVGRKLTLKLLIEDLPKTGGKGLARVTLRRDGGDERILRVPVGQEREITFELDHRGPTVLEIEAEAAARELTLANNRSVVVINGVRDRLRVLLVSGEPHAGERAWRNILKSDPSVDLVHFTILRPPEKQDGTPIRELSLIAFPTRELFEVKLEEFDLVIFDRYRRRGVLPSIYLDNIARYVEGGGALLEAVGPSFATPLSLYRTPLGRVLPAEPSGMVLEQGYRPRVTEVGLRHPVTADLAGANPKAEPRWGRWFRLVDGDTKSGAVVMSGAEERPLLILDRVGEGRVAQFMSDHMWLWARGFEGGGPQAELLRRIAHWLMREPDLEEEDLRASISGGRLEILRRSLTPEQPEIEITLPSGKRETVTLEAEQGGRARGSIVAEEGGMYRVSDGRRTALAAAGPLNPREFEDVRASAALLRPLVEQSGGTVVTLATQGLPFLRKVNPGRDKHGRGWIGLKANGGYVVTGVDQIPLLPGLALLLLILGAGLIAWYREGH